MTKPVYSVSIVFRLDFSLKQGFECQWCDLEVLPGSSHQEIRKWDRKVIKASAGALMGRFPQGQLGPSPTGDPREAAWNKAPTCPA